MHDTVSKQIHGFTGEAQLNMKTLMQSLLQLMSSQVCGEKGGTHRLQGDGQCAPVDRPLSSLAQHLMVLVDEHALHAAYTSSGCTMYMFQVYQSWFLTINLFRQATC